MGDIYFYGNVLLIAIVATFGVIFTKSLIEFIGYTLIVNWWKPKDGEDDE